VAYDLHGNNDGNKQYINVVYKTAYIVHDLEVLVLKLVTLSLNLYLTVQDINLYFFIPCQVFLYT
jgi:hypothetical protein